MHELNTERLSRLNQTSWWVQTTADLERLAVNVLNPLPGGWVRRGDNFIRVGNVKHGADARKLEAELTALSSESRRILGDGAPGNVLRAAAYYHLRFENIHPLCEANGRIGRLILAKQLEQSLRIPATDTLAGLKDWEGDYRRLFATNKSPVMFELLLDLLSRITGIDLPPEASRLPASIEPRYPQKNVPRNVPRLHPEKGLADSNAVRDFAKKQQQRRSAGAFRRFF